MSLENYTGNISDLVATNPTGTDPRSQGDDHLRGIKYTLKQSFPLATGPLLVGPGVSAKLDTGGTKVLIGNASEDALQIDTAAKTVGAVSPYLLKGDIAGQSLSPNGYVKLASGLIIQWGSVVVTTLAANTPVASAPPFPIPFPTAVLHAQVSPVMSVVTAQVLSACVGQPDLASMSIQSVSSVAGVTFSVNWLAIGY